MKVFGYGCLILGAVVGTVCLATGLWILWNGRPDDDAEDDEA